MIRAIMKNTLLVLGVVLLAPGPVLHAEELPPDFAKTGRPFLEKYCIGCHGGKKPKAELSLELYRDAAAIVKQRKVWDNVLKMIAAGEMPPKGKIGRGRRVAEAESFVTLVKAVFDHADRNAKPDPGRVTMRRLNRVEYRNTIRDLIGVEFDPTEDFPSDDIGHGFDNIGDVLTLSPVLMERYLAAAETIMSRAITPNPPPVPKRHLSAIYTEPASSDSGKLVENGFRRMTTDGKEFIEVGPINTPYQWEADGEYIFRTRVFGQSGTDKPLKVTILVHGEDLPGPVARCRPGSLSGNVLKPARILKTFAVKATKRENAEILEVRVPAMPNRHRMIIAIDKPAEEQPPAKLFVEYLALEGPLDTRPASHQRLLADCRREVASRADARGPVAIPAPRVSPPAERRRIGALDQAGRSGHGRRREVGSRHSAGHAGGPVLAEVPVPRRTRRPPSSPEVKPLDEFQLASRLSYFLWSTMPDDELLDLAEKKQLTANLDAQVRRMLADPRAAALVQNFAMQWLQIKRIQFISPDAKLFPTFNDKLRAAMLKETELFVESIVREDRSILDLIDADFTFLNEPLAKHYGIADTNGNLDRPEAEEAGRAADPRRAVSARGVAGSHAAAGC